MKLADNFNGENILGASYLPPGCFHDIVGTPGTPTKYFWVLPSIWGAPSIFNWNVGCSQPKIGGRSQVCELSMGAPVAPTEGSWEHPASSTGSIQRITERAVGSFQAYYLGSPKPCSKYSWGFPGLIQGSSHGCEEGASMHSWKSGKKNRFCVECKSVLNPAEVRNAFCTPVEGCKEGGDEQGGGRVKCIPQGRGGGCRGAEGGHKDAVSQAGGYNVFHSAESRHMGANQYVSALQQIGPAQAPQSQKNPALAGVTCDNTGSIQPNRRILPQKKEWVVPCRDITTEGSSHGLGAYLHDHQDGDPFRVVISDIHNYPKWVHKSVCLKCPRNVALKVTEVEESWGKG
ncbi:hypothetical protein B0H14DRAFT_3176043 [Mycena olivaceomarginata]|nr:hypothetical protein B0H14DRAFT_3176043 [Mycena olivaceomarginata]